MQILNGCDHPQCKTSTCATFKRRTSKRPYRKFTKLSARALAEYLASQDRAENRLCPYQSAADDLYTSENECLGDQRASGAVDGKREGEHRRPQSLVPATEPSTSPAAPEQMVASSKHDFDIIPTGYSTSSRPRSTAEPPSSVNESGQQETSSDAVRTEGTSLEPCEIIEKKDPKSFPQNLFDTKVVNFLFARIFLPSDFFSPEPTENVNPADSIPAKKKLPDSPAQKEEISESPRKSSEERSTSGRGQRRVSPHPVKDRDNVTNEISTVGQQDNNFADHVLVERTLTHFSLQNVKALVKLVQKCQSISFIAQRSQVLSYPESHNVSPFHSRLLNFADQSMFHIFNTPGYTLASFRKSTREMATSPMTVSIDFGHMVQAFHWLSSFFRGSILAMSCLPTAIEGLHVSSGARKNKLERTKRASKAEAQPHHCRASEIPRKDVFHVPDERDAAHIALQVFAVLVASVPPCNLETWDIVYTCHQGGVMVPPKEVENPATIRSAQIVLDAFEDEMALNLLSRLCEAIATRIWISDMESLARKEQREQGQEVLAAGKHVVECILETLFESQQFPIPYRTRDGNYSWRYGSAQRKAEPAGAPRYIGIISEWLRHLVGKQWDGKAEIDRFSAVGGALEILWYFDRLVETPVTFQIPVMEVRFDWLKFSADWLSRPRIANPQHLLNYPFVFHVTTQIAYFRALNYAKMFQAYDETNMAARMLSQMSFPDALTGRGEIRVREKLGNLLTGYFVMEIRREHILQDAIEQLWRRDEREVRKPLKVRMGMDEGEEGVDHGGVQQEFFRLAIAEVMNPDYGMFTVDEESGMSWFRPCSLEPIYKFELAGLLFGLAIYNGLTLPVNFPLAFYRKLQGYEITDPFQISDGWPTLAKGLQSLLDWSDGDVGDVFARTYEFTAEGPGLNISVDMEKTGRKRGWVPPYLNPDYCCCLCSTASRSHVYRPADKPEAPNPKSSDDDQDGKEDPKTLAATKVPDLDNLSENDGPKSKTPAEEQPSQPSSPQLPPSPDPSSPPPEASLVTNANREQYVSDYIFWLTSNSIRPQFEAFATHFYTCISPRAPGLLAVRDFKRLVEGNTPDALSVDALRAIAGYDGGYHPSHPTIAAFWTVVHDFSPAQLAALLEFVTASDRVPATGVASVQFSVQKNGEGDERLPTSLTCYGRLLLPQYSGEAVLREKLCLAIENCKGFGQP
ncbi:MAG: hypothetical protein Q9173_001920 [Seirophora scorigena]